MGGSTQYLSRLAPAFEPVLGSPPERPTCPLRRPAPHEVRELVHGIAPADRAGRAQPLRARRSSHPSLHLPPPHPARGGARARDRCPVPLPGSAPAGPP